MAMSAAERHEIVKRGEEIYQTSIRPKVEIAENIGKQILIDIQTGDYEIDADGIAASRRLRQRRPDARCYGARIGYDAVYAIGGALRKTTDL
jgi:hypothetical protein